MNKPLLLITLLMACTGRDIASEPTSESGSETSTSTGTLPGTTQETPTTGDPWVIEPDPAFFAEGCKSITTCECENPRYESVEECQQLGAAAMVGAELEAKVLGLHFDKTCFRDADFFDRDLRYGCMGYKEYQRTHPNDLWFPDFDSCGACVPGYGDRQEGESCTSYHVALNDCAPGLRCQEGVCKDPCVVVGTPCGDAWYDGCQTGYDKNTNWDERFICDEVTHLCTGGVAGKPCINPKASGSANFCGGEHWELTCINGLCQETPLPGKGEPCDFVRPCQEGMVCMVHGIATCEIPAQVGEPCPFAELCDDYLLCQDGVCVQALEQGEPCTNDLQKPACRAYLSCVEGVCTPDQPAVCD